jgi:CheY-like chemotaxis protein
MRHLPLIVVIEPEWPTRSYLRAELEELGYEVLVFASTEDAARTLAQWGFLPSLLVIDLSRDGASATGVSDLLAGLPDVPLVLIASPLRALPEYLQRRSARIVQRPVSVREVVRVISELVRPPLTGR